MKLRTLSQSDISRLAGVSRQAVSLWLDSGRGSFDSRDKTRAVGDVDIRSSVLLRLSDKLRLSPERLSKPIVSPQLEKRLGELEVTFLWDQLYPSVMEFCIGIVRHESRALGRLVQNLGLYESAKIVGSKIWRMFPEYRQYIIPARREQCEKIWELYNSRQKQSRT